MQCPFQKQLFIFLHYDSWSQQSLPTESNLNLPKHVQRMDSFFYVVLLQRYPSILKSCSKASWLFSLCRLYIQQLCSCGMTCKRETLRRLLSRTKEHQDVYIIFEGEVHRKMNPLSESARECKIFTSWEIIIIISKVRKQKELFLKVILYTSAERVSVSFIINHHSPSILIYSFQMLAFPSIFGHCIIYLMHLGAPWTMCVHDIYGTLADLSIHLPCMQRWNYFDHSNINYNNMFSHWSVVSACSVIYTPKKFNHDLVHVKLKTHMSFLRNYMSKVQSFLLAAIIFRTMHHSPMVQLRLAIEFKVCQFIKFSMMTRIVQLREAHEEACMHISWAAGCHIMNTILTKIHNTYLHRADSGRGFLSIAH